MTERYGFEVDPKQKIYDMTVSQKQTVEIVKNALPWCKYSDTGRAYGSFNTAGDRKIIYRTA